MSFVLHLAMTAAELHNHGNTYPHIAWMACHFSPYGTGLSNLPDHLPKDSLLIVNDRTPVFGHSPKQIATQLADITQQLGCCGILLDFQRPGEAQTQAIADAVCDLPCPVCITPPYAQGRKCAVFLPPIPMTTPTQDYFSPWRDREIWVEAATDMECIRLTKEGNQRLPPLYSDQPYPHTDPNLYCRYRMDIQPQHIDFHLLRDADMLRSLMEDGEKLGITRFVGLYQQLGASFSQLLAQDTARFQS